MELGVGLICQIMNWHAPTKVVPALDGVKVRNVTLIRDTDRDAGRNVGRHDGVTFEEVKGKWIITLPEQLPSPIANVIEVKTNMLLSELEPVEL